MSSWPTIVPNRNRAHAATLSTLQSHVGVCARPTTAKSKRHPCTPHSAPLLAAPQIASCFSSSKDSAHRSLPPSAFGFGRCGPAWLPPCRGTKATFGITHRSRACRMSASRTLRKCSNSASMRARIFLMSACAAPLAGKASWLFAVPLPSWLHAVWMVCRCSSTALIWIL